MKGLCKAKHNRLVELLLKATFTFLSSSVRIYKQCQTLHVTNDDASNSPDAVAVGEEGRGVTFFGSCLSVRADFFTN